MFPLPYSFPYLFKLKICNLQLAHWNFDRFGRVSNEEVRGFAIRGWNYLDKNPKYQEHCSNETSLADCFEKYTDNGSETDVPGFSTVHGNYFHGKYSKAVTCGDSIAASYSEDAQGVVCQWILLLVLNVW